MRDPLLKKVIFCQHRPVISLSKILAVDLLMDFPIVYVRHFCLDAVKGFVFLCIDLKTTKGHPVSFSECPYIERSH